MKKFFLAGLLCLLTAMPTEARPPKHFGHPPKIHKMAPHRHSVRHVGSGIYFLSGLVGATVGSLIVGNQHQNRFEDNDRCLVLVSKSTGKVTKKCITTGANTEVVYVD